MLHQLDGGLIVKYLGVVEYVQQFQQSFQKVVEYTWLLFQQYEGVVV